MLDLIHAVADDGVFLEVQQHYARNILVGFARLGTARSVGIVANQPAVLAGTPRHQRLGEGRALRRASATRSTSRW